MKQKYDHFKSDKRLSLLVLIVVISLIVFQFIGLGFFGEAPFCNWF